MRSYGFCLNMLKGFVDDFNFLIRGDFDMFVDDLFFFLPWFCLFSGGCSIPLAEEV